MLNQKYVITGTKPERYNNWCWTRKDITYFANWGKNQNYVYFANWGKNQNYVYFANWGQKTRIMSITDTGSQPVVCIYDHLTRYELQENPCIPDPQIKQYLHSSKIAPFARM